MSQAKIFYSKFLIALSIVALVLLFQNCGDSFELNKKVLDDITQSSENLNDDSTQPPKTIDPDPDPDPVKAKLPKGLSLLKSTHRKIGGGGDNWTLTWAKDNSIFVSMDDGNWLSESYGRYSNALYRLTGDQLNFSTKNVSRIKSYPNYPIGKYCHFGHGLLAVKGILYSFVSQCGEKYLNEGSSNIGWSQYFAVKLLKSSDMGATWKVIKPNGTTSTQFSKIDQYCSSSHNYFFCKQGSRNVDGQKYYSFVFNAVVQAGKDYSDRSDEYIYIYSPVPKTNKDFDLELARAPIDGLENKSQWQYLRSYNSDGSANWTSTFSDRKPSTTYSGKGRNWFSYLPDITYNKGLDLYIMVNGSYISPEFNAKNNSKNSTASTLSFYYSKNPYGPWTEFQFFNDFYVDSKSEQTYQFKLDPKRISQDGTEMILIWSDSGNSFSLSNYTFQEMKIKIQLD